MKKTWMLLLIVLVLFGCAKKDESSNNTHYCNDDEGTCGVSEENTLDYEGFDDQEHIFIESSMNDVIKMFEKKQSGIVYFGYPKCPWCIEAVPVMNECAKLYNKNIYYVRTKDDNGKYLYTDQEKKKLFVYIKDYLDCDDKGNKHLFVPYVLVIKDGNIVQNHLGTVKTHDSENRKMTKEETEELESIYKKMFVEN